MNDDVTGEHLKDACYVCKVAVTESKAMEIEINTREQNGSGLWMDERRKRLIRVGAVAKMSKTTKLSNKVFKMIYGSFRGNEATCYGCTVKATARDEYITYQQ